MNDSFNSFSERDFQVLIASLKHQLTHSVLSDTERYEIINVLNRLESTFYQRFPSAK